MTRSVMFLDGPSNTPGCRCGASCGFPCWQRAGIAEPCEACGCPRDLFPADENPRPAEDSPEDGA